MFDKRNPEILDQFLNYLIAVKGYSINTIKAYNSDLLIFFNFVKRYLNLKIPIKNFNTLVLLQIKEADILAFLVQCNYSKDNNPYTRQRKLTAIRVFFKWLLSTFPSGATMQNPCSNINNIQKNVRLPKYLTLNQAKKIQEIFTKQNAKYPERNNAIISLFLSTGIRLSELVNINLKDIDFNQHKIIILGKNNSERIVYYNNHCQKQLYNYLKSRNYNQNIISMNEALFLSNQGKRISISTVKNIIKQASELIHTHFSVHTLRHTAATILYTYVNQDVLLLKKFLGHKSIKSTEIYTHISNQDIKNAVDKNPLNAYITTKIAA